MDIGTIIAIGAAGLSAIGTFIAIWQARSASKQATHAKDQADAAKLQALEAIRSANAAENQVTVAQAQLKHMQDQVQARTLNEVRTNFSQFISSIDLFVIACNRFEKHLHHPQEGESITDMLQELVLANPIAQPSAIVLASHLPGNSPIILVLNESLAAITEFWAYFKGLTDALGRQDAEAVARDLHQFHSIIKRIALSKSALYRVGVENLVPPGAVTVSRIFAQEPS